MNFTMETKIIKLCSENYENLVKKMKEYPNKWKEMSWSLIGKYNIAKMYTVHPK